VRSSLLDSVDPADAPGPDAPGTDRAVTVSGIVAVVAPGAGHQGEALGAGQGGRDDDPDVRGTGLCGSGSQGARDDREASQGLAANAGRDRRRTVWGREMMDAMQVTATAPTRPVVDVRRSGDRAATRISWLDSRHSFSFGHHYDPANTHHGLLLVNNDDVVSAGSGFETHPHRDMEIVTWVLQGSLVHQDSTGHSGLIYPGLAQRMSAGTGILHSEKNDSWRLQGTAHTEPVHFVQMWVVPDTDSVTPGYEQLEIEHDLLAGGLVTVASGMPAHDGASAIRIANRDAALHVARLRPSQSVQLPDAPWLHLFVARGSVELEGAGPLAEGDSVRCTATGAQRVTATEAAEVLVWEMHSCLDG